MEEIRLISKEELPLVIEIVYKTWPDAYREILSAEQMEYMLTKFYNLESLEASMENGHVYYAFFENEIPFGFMGIEAGVEPDSLKIHKLYVLPESQGKKVGVKLLQKAVEETVNRGLHRIFLNVNRFNKAISFYQAMGLSICKQEDIDIGNNYLMEDFVMEKMV